MNFDSNDAGAQASSETVAPSNDVGAAGGASQSHIPANYDQGGGTEAGNVGAGAVEAGAEAVDKPALPPLTPEEYEKRHQNINAALRESRTRERETKRMLDEVQATIKQMQTSQPQAFERYNLDAQIADFRTIDFDRWFQTNPQEARAAAQQYQAVLARKDQLDQQAAQHQQETQRQQGQQQVQQLVETLNEQEVAIRLVRPDYDNAVAHLKAELTKDANNMGLFGDAAEQAVMTHLVTLGQRVQAAGKDLAEFGYELAVQRGYKAGAAPITPPPAGTAAPAAAPAANLAPMIAGQQASKTISDVGTSGGGGAPSFEETMAGLEGAAARAFWEKAKKSGGRG